MGGLWSRGCRLSVPHPCKPGRYGCRRRASGRGPGANCGVPLSAGPLRRGPPPGSRGAARCLRPGREASGAAQGLWGLPSAQDGTVHPPCPFALGWEAPSGFSPSPCSGPIPVASPGCCRCPGPPESGLWARRWCRPWQPQSGAPACGAKGKGPGSPTGLRASQLPPGLGEGPPSGHCPSPQLLTCSSSPKRRKAGTRSSCCSSPCSGSAPPLGGSKTCGGREHRGCLVCQRPLAYAVPHVHASGCTWLTTCRTPLVARRSATSTLAFCTQTLWKAANRAQPRAGAGGRLRVGPAATEIRLGTQAPTGGPQPCLDTLRTYHGCPDPHQGPCTRGTGVHMQTQVHRRALAGRSLLAQRHCSEYPLCWPRAGPGDFKLSPGSPGLGSWRPLKFPPTLRTAPSAAQSSPRTPLML